MKILNKRQMKALKLRSEGKKYSEIARLIKTGQSGAHYAVKSGQENIASAIDVLEWATKERVISPDQLRRLRKLFQVIQDNPG